MDVVILELLQNVYAWPLLSMVNATHAAFRRASESRSVSSGSLVSSSAEEQLKQQPMRARQRATPRLGEKKINGIDSATR